MSATNAAKVSAAFGLVNWLNASAAATREACGCVLSAANIRMTSAFAFSFHSPINRTDSMRVSNNQRGAASKSVASAGGCKLRSFAAFTNARSTGGWVAANFSACAASAL
ncbi:MAG: hypothetical protein QF920_08520, partial [Verrucomicrobiota bacterium]|nr:hypothetical protein [Verrucomicrobiota bacterium]